MGQDQITVLTVCTTTTNRRTTHGKTKNKKSLFHRFLSVYLNFLSSSLCCSHG